MNIVIVESPAKAKTINKYLGADYKVIASFGHVRDLSPKTGSVLPEEDFAMKWEISANAAKHLASIAQDIKNSEKLILATDPDREGEAISWHVLEILRQKKLLKDKKIQRVVFNAITKSAITEAIKHPRDIDLSLVDAYLARRALDYLFGFTLSPILWRKLPGARSAGRVQSVALRLLCDREAEIEAFNAQDYWSICAKFSTEQQQSFFTKLVEYNHQKLDKLAIDSAEKALFFKEMIESSHFSVAHAEAKPIKRHPSPPFTTSTLQQAASAKLGFSPSRTMQISQTLYEGIALSGETTGLITYMRTDSVHIANEAIEEARQTISQEFGTNFLPQKPRFYNNKAKNAQEAHEAIRPTLFKRSPASIQHYLTDEQFKLYDLIWKRALASQMSSAELERTVLHIEAQSKKDKALLRATGSVVRFQGFLKAYQDHKEDEQTPEDENAELPLLSSSDKVKLIEVKDEKHTTEPPPRYSEASLIKKLEELGIGRPSTYASTMATLKDRGYTVLERKRLIPAAKGRIVVAFLEHFFHHYIEYNFTAQLEDELDLIANGKLAWKEVLQKFWKDFTTNIEATQELRISEVIDSLNETLSQFLFPTEKDGKDPRLCPHCQSGSLSLKLGRYGAFIGCSNYPDCNYAKHLDHQSANQDATTVLESPLILGYGLGEKDETEALTISLRSGRFGPYVQYGEDKNAKRVALPKGWNVEKVDLEKARALLLLPRHVGIHPETSKEIIATIGRFGPYLSHDGKSISLEDVEDVFTIGINHAVELLSKPSKSSTRRNSASPLKEIGEHPKGGKITLHNGRFGPYIKWNGLNVTVGKTYHPESLSLEEALSLISKKEEALATKPTKKKTAKTTKSKK